MITENWGGVMVLPSFRNDWIRLCSISSTWNDVPAGTCTAWVAQLMTASATQRTITVFFYDAPACAAIPTYSNAPAAGYLLLSGS